MPGPLQAGIQFWRVFNANPVVAWDDDGSIKEGRDPERHLAGATHCDQVVNLGRSRSQAYDNASQGARAVPNLLSSIARAHDAALVLVAPIGRFAQ